MQKLHGVSCFLFFVFATTAFNILLRFMPVSSEIIALLSFRTKT